MGDTTEIGWCDKTFNPWIGCTKVSPACDHCYAETYDKRTGGAHWGPGAPRRRTSVQNWNKVIKWDKEAGRTGIRPRVFCASLADVFDNEVPDEWRRDLFNLIGQCTSLNWLLLTKRIGNVKKMLPWDWEARTAFGHVGLMITVCNQEEVDRDVPKLLATPARWRGLSIEPMLGPIDLRNHRVCTECGDSVATMWKSDPYADQSQIWDGWQCPLHYYPSHGCEGVLKHKIDWVITGGESGPGYRETKPEWVRAMRDQCKAAGVAFYHKQWSGIRPKINGCALDGVEYKEFPEATAA